MSFWNFWKKEKAPDPVPEVAEEYRELNEPEPMIEESPEEALPNIPPLDLMKVKYVDSPNKSTRQGEVKYIVLHHTGPGSFNGIVNWLCDKQAKASAHYVVGTSGQLTQLVNTSKEAWHAGRASFRGEQIDNHFSIGIEICNIGVLQKDPDDGNYYYEQGRSLKKYTGKVEPVPTKIIYPGGKRLEGYAVPYPEKQLNKVVALCKALVEKYPQVGPSEIITHFEIATPAGRKNDPFGLDMDYVRKLIFNK